MMVNFFVEMNEYNVIYMTVMKTYPQRNNEFHKAEAKEISSRVKSASAEDRSVVFQAEIDRLRKLATERKAQSLMYF